MPADDSLREPNWLADAPAAAADDSRSTDALAAEIQTLEEMIRQPAAGPTYSDDDECRRIVRLVEQIGKPATTGSTEVGSSVDNGPRERIGHYELLVKLGEGGMGAVYKARHTRLDKLVALKVLPADRLGDAQAVARFEREMQAVGRLSHPNIVAAHDAGDADGRHYLVMELVEGTDLSTIVRRCGPLPIAEACEVIRATAEGLQHAHGFGMVHRDIKPGNLMLTHEGRVKILDMGLALLDAMKNAGKAELTTTGQLMGTIDYMAPEQGNNSHTVDIRADVYSLGATLFKLLTGEAPFHGPKYDSPISKLAALAVETPRRLGDVRADVPAELSDLVAHMLAKQPDGRPATPHEIVERLAPWAAGARLDEVARIAKETTDRPADGADSATFAHLRSSFTGTHPSIAPRVAVAPSGPIRRRPRGPVIAAAAGAAALVLFGIWFIIRDKDGNEIARVEVPSGGSAEVQTGSAPLAPVLRGEGPGVRGSATESRPTIAPPSPTPTAVASSVPKTPAVLAPVATKTPDSSQSLVGLVPRPAKLIGVERWQLETTDPRLAFSSHSLTWNAAGTHLAFIATSGTEHQVRVYEYVAGKLHLRHLLPTNNTATSNAWVSWSPDGKQLAAKLRDTLVIWRLDGRSAAIVAKRLIPGTLHYHAQWSPTEPWLAIVTPQGKVFFWNPGTDELHSLDIPTPKMSQVFCQIAWRPDGTQLALSGGSGNDTIYLVKPLQGVIRSLQLESPFMTASYYRSLSPTAWSPDGSLLTVLLKNDEIQVWDAEQGEKKFAFAGRKGGAVNSSIPRFLPDGQSIVQSDGESIRGWSAIDGKPLGDQLKVLLKNGFVGIPGPKPGLVTTIRSGAIQIGDLQSGEIITALDSAALPSVRSLAWSPDGETIAVGASDKTLRFLDPAGGKPREPIKALPHAMGAISWSPDGRRLTTAVGSTASDLGPYRKVVQTWDVSARKVTSEFAVSGETASALACSPDGKYLAVGTNERLIFIYADGKPLPLHSLTGPRPHPGQGLFWSPDNRHLVVSEPQPGGPKAETTIYDAIRGEMYVSLPPMDRYGVAALNIAFSPRGDHFVMSTRTAPKCAVWTLDGKVVREIPGLDGHSVSWSPDGRWIAAGSGGITFYDAETGQASGQVSFPANGTGQSSSPILFQSWSPDSKLLAIAGRAANTIGVIDVERWEVQWFAVLLTDGETAIYDGRGRPLFTPPAAENELRYVVEPKPDAFELLTPKEFAIRFGTESKSHPSSVEP